MNSGDFVSGCAQEVGSPGIPALEFVDAKNDRCGRDSQAEITRCMPGIRTAAQSSRYSGRFGYRAPLESGAAGHANCGRLVERVRRHSR